LHHWLTKNFDLGWRAALNYCNAAEYVARKSKSETVADFTNLAPTVLYALAASKFKQAAILAATRKGRVDITRAAAICRELELPPVDPGVDGSDVGSDPADNDEDVEKILDGPPPDVPPPAPIATPDIALPAFDQAVGAIKKLMTKLPAQFAGTIHSTSELQSIEQFIHAVKQQKEVKDGKCS
jgi:hypothetical protein